MFDDSDIPASLVERAMTVENLMIAFAYHAQFAELDAHNSEGAADGAIYEALRREFLANETLKPLLPDFVRTCRTLDVFWPASKAKPEPMQIAATSSAPPLCRFSTISKVVTAPRSMLPLPRRHKLSTAKACMLFGKRRCSGYIHLADRLRRSASANADPRSWPGTSPAVYLSRTPASVSETFAPSRTRVT